MNKEYNQIIDEAYSDYCNSFNPVNSMTVIPTQTNIVALTTSKVEPNSKELFIHKCEHNIEYSIRWGLKIEERELSLEERMDYWFHNSKPNRDVCDYVDELETTLKSKELDKSSVPTKLITVTYKDKKLEIYE